MTMLTIDTEDSRTAKALQLAANAGQWIKVRDKDGRPLAFGVPSQHTPSQYYLVTTHRCECVDFKRRGQPCKHIAAVAIHVARVKAEKITTNAARYDEIFKRFGGD
jgi:predicted nucleic acid-binding Zn finger protein